MGSRSSAHPTPRCGYKRRARANAQQLSASEPSLPQISRVSTRQPALVLRHVSGGCCPVLQIAWWCAAAFFCGHAMTSPGRFSALKERLLKSKSKRAPRATGVFLKMASRSCVSGCGRFLASSDGHDRCPSCLGFQHAEAALVDESCSHCGNMTIAMLRSRYLLTKRGGIPLAMPRSSSSVFWRATSAHGQGDLRITVRASPSSTSPRASGVRSRTDCYAFLGRWERRAALEASAFSWALKAGRLVPGGAGRSPATASGFFLPGSAWGGD